MVKLMIKILKEIKKTIKPSMPPEKILFKYIPNETNDKEMNEFLRSRYKTKKSIKNPQAYQKKETAVKSTSSGELDLYILDKTFDEMYSHCTNLASKGLEAMGFLIGEICKNEKQGFSIIQNIVTSKLESTAVSVRFHRDSFQDLFNKLDDITYDYILIGWYHSHPGFSSFMSNIDRNTQEKMFNKKYHAAVVIDPINYEMRSFRIHQDICVEIPYAIFSKK